MVGLILEQINLSFCRNNAGIYSQNLEFSEEKIEMTFATNYLGNLILAHIQEY